MILELNKHVQMEEISELTLSGVSLDKDCKVEFTFSKAALIGFATNLFWLYEDIDRMSQTHFHMVLVKKSVGHDFYLEYKYLF